MTDSRLGWLVQPLALLMFGIFVFLQYHLIFAKGGLIEEYQTSKKIQRQIQLNQKLEKRNDMRLQQIVDLKKGDMRVVESLARNELELIKKNEKYYQIVYR